MSWCSTVCATGHLLVQVNLSEARVPVCTVCIQVCLQAHLYDVPIFMSRTIWPIKGTQVRTLTRLFVRQMSVYSRAYPRMHHISPGVSFPGAKRYTPWAGEESLDPQSAVASICSQILGEKVTPRASADYSLSLTYSLLLYGCANEDYYINLPCAFLPLLLVG